MSIRTGRTLGMPDAGPSRGPRGAVASIAAVLGVAAAVTLLPLIGALPGATAAKRAHTTGGLASEPPATAPGYWFTLANGDTIRDLLREGGVLWSATDGGGVVRWDLGDGTHQQHLAPQSGLPGNDVRALLRDRRGTLWAGTSRGLARLDEAAGRWRAVGVDPGLLPSASVTSLAEAGDGGLWVGFEQRWDPEAPHPALDDERGAFVGGGVARFDAAAGVWGPVVGAVSNEDARARVPGLPSANVTSTAFDGSGRLWVGTRPYFAWRDDACGRPSCPPEEAAWLDVGGGLAASDDLAVGWRHWTRATDEFCLASTNHVTAVAADAAGRVWVATRGRGLQAFLDGLAVDLCRPDTGHRHYERSRDALPGNHLWSLAIGGDGRVWVGVGDGERGLGLAVLDHRGSLEDPDDPRSDDEWTTVGLDGYTGAVDALITAVDVDAYPDVALGTRDDRSGDGWGVRLVRMPGPGDASEAVSWTALATADAGLPSNQITAVAAHPRTGQVWFGTRSRGVAVWDGAAVRAHAAFGRAGSAGSLVGEAVRGAAAFTVGLSTPDLVAALGPAPHLVRLGGDRGLYELGDPQSRPGGVTRVRIRPPLAHGFPDGTPLFAVARGTAGDAVTSIAFDRDGRAWVGARKTLLRPAAPGTADRFCESYPDCWYDGGIASWDGQAWRSETPPVGVDDDPARDVLALAVDARGRLWAGTGDPTADDGDGVLIRDPGSGDWTNMRRGTEGADFGGDVVTGIAVDAFTGHVWLATHHGRCVPGSATDGCPANGRIGGGVSRYDGADWVRWTNADGGGPTAGGGDGNFTAVAFDPGRGSVFAGAWAEGSGSAHWLTGVGIDAVVSACVRNCSAGAWETRRFVDDGAVRAFAGDAFGNLWLGASRDGRGAIPHRGGVHVLQGAGWAWKDTALWSNEVTALARQGDGMWLGTFDGGTARWWPVELSPGAYLPKASR